MDIIIRTNLFILLMAPVLIFNQNLSSYNQKRKHFE